MATYRKRNSKWQAIIRHKNIGTVTRSFKSKSHAIKWVHEQENIIEAGHYGLLKPDSVILGELLSRYCEEITQGKRSANTEERRLNRLIKDPISALTLDKLSSSAIAAFRDRRLPDVARTTHYDLTLIRHCLKIAIHEWGLMLSSNPVDFIKMPPASKPRQRRLNKGEY